MFKKHTLNSIVVIFFVLLISTTAFAQDAIVDIDNLDKGIININYNKNIDNMKVMITKGISKDFYDLEPNMNYPLQFGNGEYTVSILKHVKDNQYRQIGKETVKLELEDEEKVFLQSIQRINWNEDMTAIKKAKELTNDAKDDEEKVRIIYDYITSNIEYDNEKASTVQIGYTPSIDSTLKTKTGMCYDYTALFAAMLRSVGVPTKLVMGYKIDIEEYHAWNQVCLNDRWVNVDTTYDSAYIQKGIPIPMIKEAEEYKIEKIY